MEKSMYSYARCTLQADRQSGGRVHGAASAGPDPDPSSPSSPSAVALVTPVGPAHILILILILIHDSATAWSKPLSSKRPNYMRRLSPSPARRLIPRVPHWSGPLNRPILFLSSSSHTLDRWPTAHDSTAIAQPHSQSHILRTAPMT
jgi:hypothetical protein